MFSVPHDKARLRPAEVLVNEFAIVAMLQKKIARTQEGIQVWLRWRGYLSGTLLSSPASFYL